MARIYCKLDHARGTQVAVEGKLYTIGTDGWFDVDDGHAPRLLANAAKYVSEEGFNTREPAPKRSASTPILTDRSGRELTEDEVAAETKKARAQDPRTAACDAAYEAAIGSGRPREQADRIANAAARAAADTMDALDGKAVLKGDLVKGDAKDTDVPTGDALPPAPADGAPAAPQMPPVPPEVAPEAWPPVSMETTKTQLVEVLERLAKAGADVKVDHSMTKKAMLEQIQRAYDAMVE